MTNEMNEQEFERWLQSQMQHSDYVEDDGFTESLMLKLPSRPRRSGQIKARLFVSLAAMIACTLVYFILPVTIPVQQVMAAAAQPFAHLWLFAGIGAGLMSVAVLMLWNDRSRFFEL
jgi:hypothetical protein